MRVTSMAGVAVGIAVLMLGAGTATGAVSTPGLQIVPAPEGPDQAQFVPGDSNVVPATAPPATDIGTKKIQSLAAPFYACSGFSGIEKTNPVANLYADKFQWGPYAAVKVGNGGGNINWAANPYKNASWYMWFHSLRWLGQGIVAASNGDLTALTRVNTIAYDWYRDNPYSWKAKALVATLSRSATRPAGLAAAAVTFAGRLSKLGPATAAVVFANGAPENGGATDRRFADAAWSSNPAYFALREIYLAACQWGEDVLAVGSDDPAVEAKAALAGQLLADALAPTNFLLTNPAALRRAAETGGWSLVKGATNLVGDVLTNGGKPRQVDSSSFEVGRNLAATPGKVVFRNDLIELIQYTPQTESVHAVPLLAVPPWINKYYVMDLAPGRSFLEWAVQHERTVFVMSYRNADASMNGVTMDDYLSRGPCAALDVITDITASSTVDLVGLCIGGAMTAMTAAYLAQSEPDRVGTVTLLNTLLDYREPGALGVFTDEASIARLEEQMARSGFLDGEKMAGTFDVLRPNQLIFNYVVSNWLLGQTPPAFDILVWNADSTRIPATLHSAYLRSLYVENLLASGQLELGGCRLNLGDITNDAYVVGAVNDHIVPWTASYEATQLLGGDVRYVLSSGGHIAGIVNPPGPKAWFEVAAENPTDPADWRVAAEQHPGTWWTDWDAWAAERAGPMVAPPEPSAEHPPLCDAPGEYIRL